MSRCPWSSRAVITLATKVPAETWLVAGALHSGSCGDGELLCHLSLRAPISPRLKLVVFRELSTPVPAVRNYHRSCLGFCTNRLAIHPFVASSVLITSFHVSRQELTGRSESPTEQCESPCGGYGVVVVVLIVQRHAVCVQPFNVGHLLPTVHTAWMKDIHFTNDDVPKEAVSTYLRPA